MTYVRNSVDMFTHGSIVFIAGFYTLFYLSYFVGDNSMDHYTQGQCETVFFPVVTNARYVAMGLMTVGTFLFLLIVGLGTHGDLVANMTSNSTAMTGMFAIIIAPSIPLLTALSGWCHFPAGNVLNNKVNDTTALAVVTLVLGFVIGFATNIGSLQSALLTEKDENVEKKQIEQKTQGAVKWGDKLRGMTVKGTSWASLVTWGSLVTVAVPLVMLTTQSGTSTVMSAIPMEQLRGSTCFQAERNADTPLMYRTLRLGSVNTANETYNKNMVMTNLSIALISMLYVEALLRCFEIFTGLYESQYQKRHFVVTPLICLLNLASCGIVSIFTFSLIMMNQTPACPMFDSKKHVIQAIYIGIILFYVLAPCMITLQTLQPKSWRFFTDPIATRAHLN